jgi:hypothetical protein
MKSAKRMIAAILSLALVAGAPTLAGYRAAAATFGERPTSGPNSGAPILGIAPVNGAVLPVSAASGIGAPLGAPAANVGGPLSAEVASATGRGPEAAPLAAAEPAGVKAGASLNDGAAIEALAQGAAAPTSSIYRRVLNVVRGVSFGPTRRPEAVTALESRAAADINSGLKPADDSTSPRGGASPAPPTPPSADDAARTFKRNTWLFTAAIAANVGALNAFASHMPTLAKELYGQDISTALIPEIGIWSAFAMFVGRIVSPIPVQGFGSRKAYMGYMGLATVFIGLQLFGAIHPALLTIPLLVATAVGYRFMATASATAASTIASTLFGANATVLEKVRGRIQIFARTIAFVTPVVATGIMSHFGLVPMILVMLGFFAASMTMISLLRFRSTPATAPAAGPRPGAPMEPAASSSMVSTISKAFSKTWSSITSGYRLVWNDALLRSTVLASCLVYLFLTLLYEQVAQSFSGMLVKLNLASPDQFSPIYLNIYAAFSLGGILGGWLLTRQKTRSSGNETEKELAQQNEEARQSMLRWMLLGTLSLATFATFMLPLSPLAALVALPAWTAGLNLGSLTLPVLGMLVFGTTFTILTTKLDAFFQTKVQIQTNNAEGAVAQSLAFQSAAIMLTNTLVLVVTKFLFSGDLLFGFHPFVGFTGLTGAGPFIAIFALTALIGGILLILRRKMAVLSAPPPASKSQ